MDLSMEIARQTKKFTGIHFIGKSISDYGILLTKKTVGKFTGDDMYIINKI
jgi:hypothetical protein